MTDSIVELLEQWVHKTYLTIYTIVYTMVYIITKEYLMSKLPSYTQKAKAEYRKRITTVTITINPRTELEIYEKISEQENKSGYIKSLIERDIKGGSHGD